MTSHERFSAALLRNGPSETQTITVSLPVRVCWVTPSSFSSALGTCQGPVLMQLHVQQVLVEVDRGRRGCSLCVLLLSPFLRLC